MDFNLEELKARIRNVNDGRTREWLETHRDDILKFLTKEKDDYSAMKGDPMYEGLYDPKENRLLVEMIGVVTRIEPTKSNTTKEIVEVKKAKTEVIKANREAAVEEKKIEQIIKKVKTQAPSKPAKVSKPKPAPKKKSGGNGPKNPPMVDRTGHYVMFNELGTVGPVGAFMEESEQQSQGSSNSSQMALDFKKKVKKVPAPKKSSVSKAKAPSETLALRARKLGLEEAKLEEQKRRHMEGESLDREHLKTRNRERISKEKRERLIHDSRIRVAEIEKEKIEIRTDAERSKKELEAKTKKSIQTSRARAMTQKAKVVSEAMVEREKIKAEAAAKKMEHSTKQKQLDREHRKDMLDARNRERARKAKEAAIARRREKVGAFLMEQSPTVGYAYKAATGALGFGSKFGGVSHAEKASNSNSYSHDVIAGLTMALAQRIGGAILALGPALGVAMAGAAGAAFGRYLYKNGGEEITTKVLDFFMDDPFEKDKDKKDTNQLNPLNTGDVVNNILKNGTDRSNQTLSGKIGGGKVKRSPESDRQKQAMEYFISQGWSKEQAAGIVGNLMQESGSNLNTKALNKKENAQGIAQWRKERLAKFKELYGKDIKDASFEEQLKYVDWELRNTENKAGKRLSGAMSPEAAAAAIDEFYERSSGQHRNQRIANARNLASGVYTQPNSNTDRMGVAMKENDRMKKAAAANPTPVIVSNPSSVSAPVVNNTTVNNAPEVDPPIRQLILNNTFPQRVL